MEHRAVAAMPAAVANRVQVFRVITSKLLELRWLGNCVVGHGQLRDGFTFRD